MTDVIIVPRVQTETETIRSPISKCGDNWWKDVRVRASYKKTDVAYRTLPSLGDPQQVEHLDLGFPEEIVGDQDRVIVFVAEHLDKLSDRQRKNIEVMLGRVSAYLADAETIRRLWATGLTTSTLGPIPPWPLNGQPQGPVNGNIEEGHKKDSERWKRLILGALRNLRCAEEVVKKATIRARNKDRHTEGRVFGQGGVAPQDGGNGGQEPRKGRFSPFVPPTPLETHIDEGDLEEGEIDLEGEAPVAEEPPVDEEAPVDEEPFEEEDFVDEGEVIVRPSTPAKKKKKDNTLLIAGAAAFGVLALSKG